MSAKSISKMTLAELKSVSDFLGISYATNVNKQELKMAIRSSNLVSNIKILNNGNIEFFDKKDNKTKNINLQQAKEAIEEQKEKEKKAQQALEEQKKREESATKTILKVIEGKKGRDEVREIVEKKNQEVVRGQKVGDSSKAVQKILRAKKSEKERQDKEKDLVERVNKKKDEAIETLQKVTRGKKEREELGQMKTKKEIKEMLDSFKQHKADRERFEKAQEEEQKRYREDMEKERESKERELKATQRREKMREKKQSALKEEQNKFIKDRQDEQEKQAGPEPDEEYKKINKKNVKDMNPKQNKKFSENVLNTSVSPVVPTSDFKKLDDQRKKRFLFGSTKITFRRPEDVTRKSKTMLF